MMKDPYEHYIQKYSSDLYTVCTSFDLGLEIKWVLVYREHICTYFQYDAVLHKGKPDLEQEPVRYYEFCTAYQCEATSWSHFAYYHKGDNGESQLVIPG